MLRKILSRFRSRALGLDENDNVLMDLEFLTGRAVTTMTDHHGRTGYVFTGIVQELAREYADQDTISGNEFATDVVTRTNRILAAYDSPLCDRIREINAEILTT